MSNHGAITHAGDLHGAVELTLLLEWACTVYAHAAALGTPRVLDAGERSDVIRAVTERGYGATRALDGSDRDTGGGSDT
jgi:L-fuculose-phosphate aldolase